MSLDPTRFALNEQKNNIWSLTVEEQVELEDVLKPNFLANVSSQLRPYDRVIVRTDSGAWYAELLVLTCGRVWAKTMLIFHVDLAKKEEEKTESESYDEFFVKWRGPHLKFCVIRRADNEPIKEQLDNKLEADTWLQSYLMTM